MMKKNRKRLLALVLALVMALLCVGCSGGGSGADNTASDQSESAAAGDENETHLIGIEVYSQDDPELRMFFNYYKDYIAESFPVTFIESEALDTVEDEVNFVEQLKADGGEAIISFFSTDLETVLDACAENEIYYVFGTSTISEELYESVKDNPWYLGAIGPSDSEEYMAGCEMAQNFIDQDAASFLILSGGAGDEANFMHYTRVTGMLDTLQESLGLTYSEPVEDLASVTEVTNVDTGTDVSVVICPGYVQFDPGYSNMMSCFEEDDYDALMSAMSISSIVDELKAEIKSSDSEMLVGTVDSFTQENYDAVETTDAKGKPLLNFVYGVYGPMGAPAFVAAFNAINGDADVVNPDGEAFQIYQRYWKATSRQEYEELYGYTESIYENAYSASDLMSVIRAYNDDANFEEFQTLAESTDIDSVLSRME